jgi:hypothetical protein
MIACIALKLTILLCVWRQTRPDISLMFCSSATSPRRHDAVALLSLQAPASLLLWLRLSGAWVLGSQGISRVIELRCDAQENSLVYSKMHYYTGSARNWNVYNYTGQLPGPKSATIRGNSQDRSLQLYGELPGPKSTTIRGTPRTEVYNYTGHLQGPKSTTIRGISKDRSLQLYGATPGTEVCNYTGQLPGPKSTTIRGKPRYRSLQLYGASPRTEVYNYKGPTPRTEIYNYTGHLQGPKSTTIRGNSRDRSAALALGKKTSSAKTCTFSPTFANHP